MVLCAHPYGKTLFPQIPLGYLPHSPTALCGNPAPEHFQRLDRLAGPDPGFLGAPGLRRGQLLLRGFFRSEGRGELLSD